MATELRITSKEEVDNEVAREVISELFAFFSKDLAAEKKLSSPNQEKIGALNEMLRDLHEQKKSVLNGDPSATAKALYVYAKLLRDRKPDDGK